MVHVHGAVAVRVGEHLAGRFHRHQIGDDRIHAGFLLDFTGDGVGRLLARFVDAIDHGPFAGVGAPSEQHTAALVLDIAGDSDQPKKIMADFLTELEYEIRCRHNGSPIRPRPPCRPSTPRRRRSASGCRRTAIPGRPRSSARHPRCGCRCRGTPAGSAGRPHGSTGRARS